VTGIGSHELRRALVLVSVLAVIAILAVLTLGVLHEYGHDSSDGVESCATCATVRAPRVSPLVPATILLIVFSLLLADLRLPAADRPAIPSGRSTRGPPSD